MGRIKPIKDTVPHEVPPFMLCRPSHKGFLSFCMLKKNATKAYMPNFDSKRVKDPDGSLVHTKDVGSLDAVKFPTGAKKGKAPVQSCFTTLTLKSASS